MAGAVQRALRLGDQALTWSRLEVLDEQGELVAVEETGGALDGEPITDAELERILVTVSIAERGPRDFHERLWLAISSESDATASTSDAGRRRRDDG